MTWEVAPAGGPDPQTLTTRQGRALLAQVAEFGFPYPDLVLTGRDPLLRADLFELIAHARWLSLTPTVSTLASPLLTLENLERLRSSGAHTLSLHLDGGGAASHDGFHRTRGSFDGTLRGCHTAQELGLKLQIDTTVAPHNVGELGRIFQQVHELGVKTWTLNFPGGRDLAPEQCEIVLHFLARASQRLGVRTSEGHHYQRVLLMRGACWRRGADPDENLQVEGQRLSQHPLYRRLVAYLPRELPRRPRPVPPPTLRSAQGPVYIDPHGEVRPSLLLALSAGNVRHQELTQLYRTSWLFGQLRDPFRLRGRCGRCEFRELCGGSWARSYQESGTMVGEDPLCAYQPPRIEEDEGCSV